MNVENRFLTLLYDWDRIRYLQKKYDQLKPLIHRDLEIFAQFLVQLSGKIPDQTE